MKSILIVEDDRLIAELERDYLLADGFDVDIESDGKDGLRKYMSGDYELVILDVMLPHMSGFDICRIIRGDSNVPIIMITARKDDIDKIRGLGLGADDYMIKPFSPAEMVARVKAHISMHERLENRGARETDSSAGMPMREIKIKGLRLIPDARRVYMNGNEISLVKKEYDLLLYFAQNPDIVFSKEQLFDHIWGEEAIGDLSTVTVHINRLREKLEEDPRDPQYITTVWGAGYRMKAD